MAKFKDAELTINLGGHRAAIRGSFEIVGAGESQDFDNPDTLAGALLVEDRANTSLFPQLEHEEVDAEGETVTVTYDGINAARIETPSTAKAKK